MALTRNRYTYMSHTHNSPLLRSWPDNQPVRKEEDRSLAWSRNAAGKSQQELASLLRYRPSRYRRKLPAKKRPVSDPFFDERRIMVKSF